MGSFRGSFDGILGDRIEGWAASDYMTDGAAIIHVIIDGMTVAEVVADLYREDLELSDIRDGYAHFSVQVPMDLFDGATHVVSVVLKDSGVDLPGSPQYFQSTPSTIPAFKERCRWSKSLLMQILNKPISLSAEIKKHRKVAILCTYHNQPAFMMYHHLLVGVLEKAGFQVVVVHATSNLSLQKMQIGGPDTFVLVKTNLGYDFGSWAFGYYQLEDVLGDIDELLLINDSNILLTDDVSMLLERVRTLDTDVVGLTDSYERNTYHLQSYFMWFGSKVCQSAALPIFMSQYPFVSDKEVVIEQGELKLTKYLLDSGFTVSALYPYEQVAAVWLRNSSSLRERLIGFLPMQIPGRSELSKAYSRPIEVFEYMEYAIRVGIPLNPTHFFWDTLTEEFDFPFLKRELFNLNPSEIPSYFKLGEVLAQRPLFATTHLLEIRRRYGGRLIPLLDSGSGKA